MPMIREILENSIKTALSELKISKENLPKISLEHPEEFSHGDYSANVALVLGKAKAQNPKDLANKIAAEILKKKPREVSKVEVAGPGFINFYLESDFFMQATKEILSEKEKFGAHKNLKGEKTTIEYTDPNPFKEFHIGHLMSNAIGESISRILEKNGAKVARVCYQGDVGLHVAKTIWGIQKSGLKKPITVNDLGKAYSEGNSAYEQDENLKNEIIEINKKIYDRSDKNINNLYDTGRKISLEYFESIYKILGTEFDKYFFESETGKFGKEIVEKNIGKVFEKSDGAVIFKGENYGLHTRVFINSDGLPTYEAKELGLSKIKYDKTKYDKSIIITGNEVNDYFKVLLKAMSLIFPDLAKKTVHISHGMLRLPSGKMSSRTGDVITALSLLSDVEDKIFEKMTDRAMSASEKKKIAEKISVGALKYSILRQVSGKDIIFDFDKSISFEGDSGPYLQYSYARARSILRKAKDGGIKSKVESPKSKAEITELEKMLYRFPEIVERAGKEYSPHYIATYLIELSSSFNNFYAKGKIVDKADMNSPYKVALTEAFSIVIKNGLNLLGIAAPERM